MMSQKALVHLRRSRVQAEALVMDQGMQAVCIQVSQAQMPRAKRERKQIWKNPLCFSFALHKAVECSR
jgi:hypothetical protein